MRDSLDSEGQSLFFTVVNAEGQYSIWPAATALPRGWSKTGVAATKSDCLAQIQKLWVDMRPTNLQRSIERRRFSQLCQIPIDADLSEILDDVFKERSEYQAAQDSERSLTYHELDRLSRTLASKLSRLELGSDDRVFLVMDRSVYALAGIAACIRTGVAYVPVEYKDGDKDPLRVYKSTRSSVIVTRRHFGRTLQSLDLRMVIVDEAAESQTPAHPFESKPIEGLVYTIYTSGSTGIAKGVDVTRKNLWHYTRSLAAELGISPGLRYAYVSSFSADLGNTALFLSLFTGGSVHFLDDQVRRDPNAFQAYLFDQKIDVLKITPSHYSSLCRQRSSDFKLKWLIFGGEKLSSDLVREVFLLGQSERVANHYGPTETTIGVACYPMDSVQDVPKSASVPVGFPFGKTKFELRRTDGEVVTGSAGEAGELWVGGPSVASGYTRELELTAQKFRALEGQEGRFYTTGDLFKRNFDGSYEFVGRVDRQVKIKGYRVDPGAIESEIIKICDLSAAYVLAVESSIAGHIQLVAAVVLSKLQHLSGVTVQQLREQMVEQLPEAMVPSKILILDAIPVTGNGKVDLARLKSLALERSDEVAIASDFDTSDFDDYLKTSFRNAWSKFVGRTPKSLSENFYEAGGDSILAIQLIARLQSEGFSLKARVFFEDPTLRGLLGAVQSDDLERHDQVQFTVGRRILSPIQKWFFEKFPQGESHWNQAILIDMVFPVDKANMEKAIQRVVANHDIFATRFVFDESAWHARERVDADLELLETCRVAEGTSLAEICKTAQGEISLEKGHLLRVRVIHEEGLPDRLLLVAHHLIVDGVSWRILIDGLARAYGSLISGHETQLLNDPNLYWSWTEELLAFAALESKPWPSQPKGSEFVLPVDKASGENLEGLTDVVWIGFDKPTTAALLHPSSAGSLVKVQDVLLAAYAQALVKVFNASQRSHSLVVDVENHGRNLFTDRSDFFRSVGWYTSLFPCALEVNPTWDAPTQAKHVQQTIDAIPDSGISYGLKKYLGSSSPPDQTVSDLCFNYLGQFDLSSGFDLGWFLSRHYPGASRAPNSDRHYRFKLTGRICEQRLVLDLSYSRDQYDRETSEKIAAEIGHFVHAFLGQKGETDKFHESRSSTGLLTYVPVALNAREIKSARQYGENFLLTGVSGFVGIYVLKELLEQTSARVYCLARDKDGVSAAERVASLFQKFFPDFNRVKFAARVVVCEGDLRSARLGLASSVFEELSEVIDTVYHLAADVRLVAPVEELRQTNLLGTQRVIDFCSHLTKKRLHHLSTLSVAGQAPANQLREFRETDTYYGQDFITAYERSKFEGEVAVRRFISNGGQAWIYRTGSVLADARGTFQVNFDSNRVLQSLIIYILANIVPDKKEDLLICPVDQLASAMVRIATAAPEHMDTLHITPHEPYWNNQFEKTLSTLGYDVRLDSQQSFLSKLGSMEGQYPREVALARLWAARPNRHVNINSAATAALLQELGSQIKPVSIEWFRKFLFEGCKAGYISWPRRQHLLTEGYENV